MSEESGSRAHVAAITKRHRRHRRGRFFFLSAFTPQRLFGKAAYGHRESTSIYIHVAFLGYKLSV